MNTAIVATTTTERVILGQRAAQAIAEEAERLNCERVLIVSSGFLANCTHEIEQIVIALGTRHCGTVFGIRPHSPIEDILVVARAAKAGRADLLVSVGGGSVTDACKVATLALKARAESEADVIAAWSTIYKAGLPSTRDPAHAPDIRVLCVPTTLSGGEVSNTAGGTDTDHRKLAFGHRLATPVAIVYDPAITLHTPADLWFSTGCRSIDHAAESLSALQGNPYTDSLAETGLRLLSESMTRTLLDPTNLDARLKSQIGAWQAMTPILLGVPMGASHAIGHALGALCDVPHGYTSCVLLPFVAQWNAQAVPERLSRVSVALGSAGQPAHEVLDQLIRRFGMPRSLQDVGVRTSDHRRIAEATLDTMWGRTNPRPVERPEDIMEILALAQEPQAWSITR